MCEKHEKSPFFVYILKNKYLVSLRIPFFSFLLFATQNSKADLNSIRTIEKYFKTNVLQQFYGYKIIVEIL